MREGVTKMGFDRTEEFAAERQRSAAAHEQSQFESRTEDQRVFEEAKQRYPEQYALLEDTSSEGWVEMRESDGFVEAPKGTFFLTKPAEGDNIRNSIIYAKILDNSAKAGFIELLKFQDRDDVAWTWHAIAESFGRRR